jgi:CTP synthase
LKRLGSIINKIDLSGWKNFLWKLKNPIKNIKVGLVGKYTNLKDSYKSIYESLIHASAVNETSIEIITIDSDTVDIDTLSNLNGVIIGPGFGLRGIEGKISAIKYCRENNIPTFGICLGMQCMSIEFARNVLGLENANSTEFNGETPHPVIDLMIQQKQISDMGGTMRLGSYDCQLLLDSKLQIIYNQDTILERHRHRWEFNNNYLECFESKGFKVSGMGKRGLVEAIELQNHRWFVGVQFHPEYKSWVENPHPLFVDFVRECSKQ